MQVSYAFSQPMLPVGVPATFDLLVRFRADDAPATETRRPLNLSLVIDRSGSMAGSPLRYAIRAAKDLVDRLGDTDTLSIVTYDDNVQTVVPPGLVKDRAAIHGKLDAVRVGGTTNLGGGWLKGCEHVLKNAAPESINRVLLLTDGNANVGITDKTLLTNTARDKAETGVATTTLGFGDGFNEDLLIGMARAGGGNFYYIQSPDDASGVFQLELDSLKAVAAQNMETTFAPETGVTLSLLSGYRTSEGDGNTVHLGDVYRGEDKLLAVTVTLSTSPAIGSLPLLALSYAFDGITNNVIRRGDGVLSVAVPVGTIDDAVASAPATGVIVEIARIRIARAKDDAVELADKGDHTGAAKQLRDLIADLQAKGLNETFEIAEEIEQLSHYAGRIERKQLGANVRKELRDQGYQGASRTSSALSGRGTSNAPDALKALPTTSDVGSGVELEAYREGGKLRVRVVSKGFDPSYNVQFPRDIRAEGVHYVADELETSTDGTFYRVKGDIKRLLKAGAADPFANVKSSSAPRSSGKASVAPPTAADLDTTDDIGTGVLVQCVKDGSKLRARVVSDGYDPDWNMRFPRSIREDGMLYVVDEVNEVSGGGQYQALGTIKRFLQKP